MPPSPEDEEPPEPASERKLLIASALFCMGALAFDALAASGVAAGVPYVALVLLGAGSTTRNHALCAASAGTLFTTVGFFLPPLPSSPNIWIDLLNRALAIFAIWTTAVVVESFRRNRRRLVQANQQLREQEALARLGEMSAVVAHEVKNPLAGIRASLQVIEERIPGASMERKILGTIRDRIDALHHSLDDLLVFARPRAPHLGVIDLSTLVHRAVDQVRDHPKAEEVVFDLGVGRVRVSGDVEMCREALLNLVINAAQSMDWQGTVSITSRIDGDMACLQIRDEGPGIPAEIRDQIFQPFFTTKTRGTGLGLAIVKRTVDLHRGTLAIACPPRGGTEVTMRLPLDDPDRPAAPHSR